MAEYLIQDSTLIAIANAIRMKEESTEAIPVSNLAERIATIETGVDTSNDTVTSDTLVEGYTAHDANGKQITGTAESAIALEENVIQQDVLITQIQEALNGKTAAGGGVDTSNDTVTTDALVEGYTAHDKDGKQITGTNPYQKEQTDAAVASIATAIESKGVEVPDGATLNEMAALVDLVKTGVIEISTSAGMDAVLIEDNVGKAYKFTGTTDDTYTSGDIYVVEVSS